MGLVERVQRWIRGTEPTLVDYEAYERQVAAADQSAQTSMNSPTDDVLGRVGPANVSRNAAGSYKLQQSYDSLLSTVQELRAALDGQTRRQQELMERLGTLPQAAEALPQTSKMQADMLKIINDRLSAHATQQRKVNETVQAVGPKSKEYGEVLQALREQIEMGNEIDRQLVESFNRFSMMIDRLQLANHHAVDALQQVRDSYAVSALQMQEWIEKSRYRNSWLTIGACFMAGIALILVILLYMR